MKKFWKIVISIIFIMSVWFCFEMMRLEGQQKRIDELKNQMEDNNKEYEKIMNEVNEILKDEPLEE